MPNFEKKLFEKLSFEKGDLENRREDEKKHVKYHYTKEEIENQLNELFRDGGSFLDSENLRYLVKLKEPSKSEEIPETTKIYLSRTIFDIGLEIEDFDHSFFEKCLLVWKILDRTLFKLRYRNLQEKIELKSKLKKYELNKLFDTQYWYLSACPVPSPIDKNCLRDIGLLENIKFKDAPNIHFLRELIKKEDEQNDFIVPQDYEEFYSKIKSYENLWFTKKAYETGELKIIMTLGGAWLLEDEFLYNNKNSDVIMFIQHPFQEKVLAEVLNWQNPKYPYEMIRHWYKWHEKNRPFKFVWIRESIQPVGNIIKISGNQLNEKWKKSEGKKAYLDLIQKELELEDNDILIQFQVHDHFVRTKTTAVQLVSKDVNSSLAKIIKPFISRQLIINIILDNLVKLDQNGINKLLESFDIEELIEKSQVQEVVGMLRSVFGEQPIEKFCINRRISTNLEPSLKELTEFRYINNILKDWSNWIKNINMWVSYGTSEPFGVINPFAILLRELKCAETLLKIINCYLKKTGWDSVDDPTKLEDEKRHKSLFLIFSKYSILLFLNDEYGDIIKENPEIVVEKLKKISKLWGVELYPKDQEDIKEFLNNAKKIVEELIEKQKINRDLNKLGVKIDDSSINIDENRLKKFIKTIIRKEKEDKKRKLEGYWEKEIKWIIKEICGKLLKFEVHQFNRG